MILYNKVEDIYHTCLRMVMHYRKLGRTETTAEELFLIDFLYCFPQYISQLSRKRAFKTLKPKSAPYVYGGAKSSHAFLLEKSHWGAIRLMQAKSLFVVNGDSILGTESLVIFEQVWIPAEMKAVYSYVKEYGVSEMNKALSLREHKYEKTS